MSLSDMTIMRQGVRFVRSVGAAFGNLFGPEISPGPEVQTDEQIENWLRDQAASTQYHPTGSCAMLPKDKGGVVDANLLVYGLGTSLSVFMILTCALRINLYLICMFSEFRLIANVRVADSSIFPFEFAAHVSLIFGRLR